MSTLQATLETAIEEYNKAAETFTKLQQELLLRQRSIQTLQAVIQQQTADANTEAGASEVSLTEGIADTDAASAEESEE